MIVERLTKKSTTYGHNIAYISDEDCFDVWSALKKFMGNAIDRLADIEDIMGDDYDMDRLRELVDADRCGRCAVLPCEIGDTVYHITTCKNFPSVLDGTLYDDAGGHGTATGCYCPCELANNCPFSLDNDGHFDCKKHKNEKAIYEDVVTEIVINDMDFVRFDYSGWADFDEFGKTVFLTREDAENALKGERNG